MDALRHATLLDNIRLWDWRAYTDTITQIQALRPYYTFPETDVDRYTSNGRIKQVLLSPARDWTSANCPRTHARAG